MSYHSWGIVVVAAWAISATFATNPAAAAQPEPSADPGASTTPPPFTYKIGGRIQWDTDSYDGALSSAGTGDRRFNTLLRRARIETSGTILEDFGYVLDVNINDKSADRSAEIHAAGLKYTGWERVDVFVGRDKEPFGLEELASSKAISSIERNYFTDASDVDAQPHFGFRVDGKGGPVGWSVGAFSPDGNPKTSGGSDRIALTGRVFGAPIADDERVLHLGAAYTDRRLDDPELLRGFSVKVAKTGDAIAARQILADEDRALGLELLYLQGPWSLQAEAFQRDLKGAGGGPDGEVRHFYLQGTWTITGESRGYSAQRGIPGQVNPAGRRGAVELVAKYDDLAFDVDGEPEQNVSGYLIGANWYVNRHVKLMLNVIRVTSDDVIASGLDDDATVISTRLQVAI